MGKKLKVIHVNTSDIRGGAAIAAHRLHKALLKKNINSKMLVMKKDTDEREVIEARNNNFEKHIFSKIRVLIKKTILFRYRNRKDIIFSPAKFGLDITKNKVIQEADVIHLHWVVGGFLSLNTLDKLFSLNKKIIWTLHDSWVFTGGCHVRYGCYKFIKSCGECPILNSNFRNDLSSKVFHEKKKMFSGAKNLTIITPSKWLNECVKESNLLKNFKNVIIPNILDENIFKNINQEFSRETLNLEKDKKYICFGAFNSISTEYKGWKYLKEAIQFLDKSDENLSNEIELMIFGSSHSENIESLPFKTKFFGRLHDEYTLSLLYNAVDVFVGPSLEETFGQTFNESIFCGTPAVAFENTGTEDIIEHKKNGYLAKYKDSEDLARGIIWTLNNLDEVKIKNGSLKSKNIINNILSIYKN